MFFKEEKQPKFKIEPTILGGKGYIIVRIERGIPGFKPPMEFPVTTVDTIEEAEDYIEHLSQDTIFVYEKEENK